MSSWSLLALSSGVVMTVWYFAAKSADVLKTMVEMDPTRDALAVRAWDELSTRAILKKADPDLKTYFLKQQEFLHAVRDFQDLKEIPRTPPMLDVLVRLRASPFFSDTLRPEYDVLWVLLTQRQDSIGCARFAQLYPKAKCEGEMTVREAVEALERKLASVGV